MRDEFGFEVGPSEVYEDRLEELLDRLELQEIDGDQSALSAEQLERAACPGPVRETVPLFPIEELTGYRRRLMLPRLRKRLADS